MIWRKKILVKANFPFFHSMCCIAREIIMMILQKFREIDLFCSLNKKKYEMSCFHEIIFKGGENKLLYSVKMFSNEINFLLRALRYYKTKVHYLHEIFQVPIHLEPLAIEVTEAQIWNWQAPKWCTIWNLLPMEDQLMTIYHHFGGVKWILLMILPISDILTCGNLNLWPTNGNLIEILLWKEWNKNNKGKVIFANTGSTNSKYSF